MSPSSRLTNKLELQFFLKSCSAVIFDLDGTLFNLNAPWFDIKEYIKTHYARRYGEEIPNDERFYFMFEYIREKQGPEVLQYYLDYVRTQELIAIREHLSKPTWLVNYGLNKIAEHIRFDTFFGIVSSNFHESILEILNQYGLNDRFRVIIGRNDVNQIKPNPEGIIRVMDGYELDSEKVLYVGDKDTDEEAANRAHVWYCDVEDLQKLL
ncbi:MAG: HAD family hydrolase [Promethearchaeota archaeon]